MFLIATDEAGYGPKLGPLVVAGSAWRLPVDALPTAALSDLFAPLRHTIEIGGKQVVIDDSKVIFQPGGDQPLAGLHAAISACNHWWGCQATEFADLVDQIAAADCPAIHAAPWLQNLSGPKFCSRDTTAAAVAAWSGTGIQCDNVRCRIVTAKCFNAACGDGSNKADLLSETTLQLVRQLMRPAMGRETTIEVYCDRHGGRRYYAGVLQHIFHDANVTVVAETQRESSYRIAGSDFEARIRFSVKGDSFTPVAMSSLYAKYVRERLMQSLNEYFAQQHQGTTPLKRTAGYPTDAIRFLEQIEPTIAAQRIPMTDLVRQR